MTKRSNKQSDDLKSWGKFGTGLYKYWVDTYSGKHVDKWLRKHKYDMNSCETKEFTEYMIDGFINWINRSK